MHGDAVSLAVYVHFPWCLRKCPYCDFTSYAVSEDPIPHEEYADAVLRELHWRLQTLSKVQLSSVFFGGGTPSLWQPRSLARVLNGILDAFPRSESVEVTAECNPSSLTEARAAALAQLGINRISVGVQELRKDLLEHLGRWHDGATALNALEGALRHVKRVSADLIFGLPRQTPGHFISTVKRVLQTGVEHLSAYALTIEPNTQFGAWHRSGKLPLALEDHVADTYLQVEDFLEQHGFEHYEVSNYARPGGGSQHNGHVWQGGAYLGLGVGAVGAVADHHTPTLCRYVNQRSIARYMSATSRTAVERERESLSAEDRIRERLMLGLRTVSGVDLARLHREVGQEPTRGREAALERRQERGDLILQHDVLQVPRSRWLHLDAIVTDVF